MKQHKTVSDVGRQAVAGNNFCQVEEKTKHYLEFSELYDLQYFTFLACDIFLSTSHFLCLVGMVLYLV